MSKEEDIAAAEAALAAAQAEPEVDTSWLDPVLDKARPYGQVTGEEPKRFFQDGRYFDYAGKLIKE